MAEHIPMILCLTGLMQYAKIKLVNFVIQKTFINIRGKYKRGNIMYYYEQARLTDNINRLAQYTTGATVLSQDDLAQQAQFFGLMAGGMGLFNAGKGGYWLYKNRKDVSGAWDAYKNGSIAKNIDFKNMQGNNIFESFGNIGRNQYLDRIANNNFGTFKELSPDEFSKLGENGKIRRS